MISLLYRRFRIGQMDPPFAGPVGRWLGMPYAWAVKSRGYLYDHGWLSCRRLPRPVISVGNLTVGGTGKTPIVIWLAQWLRSRGIRVAILSRGYGRVSARDLLVSDGREPLVTPADGGDEPVLIAGRCPGAIVAVGRDRYRVGRWVLEQMAVDCFLLDDGFQHRALDRDVDLALIDATDIAGLSCLLPMGRLREPLSAAARATGIVLTRVGTSRHVQEVVRSLEAATRKQLELLPVDFSVQDFVHVRTGAVQPVQWGKGKRALLVSGIGNPCAFHRTAVDLGITVVGACTYPDHYDYTAKDVEKIVSQARTLQADVMLTTEKDAVKLRLLLDVEEKMWAVRLTVDEQSGTRLADFCRARLPLVV